MNLSKMRWIVGSLILVGLVTVATLVWGTFSLQSFVPIERCLHPFRRAFDARLATIDARLATIDARLATKDAASARHMAVLRPLEVSPVIATRITGVRRTGTEYGGWTYNATGLTPHSIVYSVGLGEDTSWDEAMMRDHGLHIWGFDPTPKAIEYVQSNPRLGAMSTFHFMPEGLATEPGTLTFTKPANPDHVSMRQGRHGGLGDTIEVPVDTLGSWMGANGHTQLDILKIDIEGSEYEILEDWIRRQWFPMDQLLVEFHHRFLKDASRHTSVLKGLKENGFEVIHDANHQEISFQRRRRPLQ